MEGRADPYALWVLRLQPSQGSSKQMTDTSGVQGWIPEKEPENSVATQGRQLGYPGLLGRHLAWINRINLCRELYSLV